MRPSLSWPKSSMPMMLRWPIDEAERASWRKRVTASWFDTISGRSSLIATFFSMWMCSAA
jgi:hypothetical protein